MFSFARIRNFFRVPIHTPKKPTWPSGCSFVFTNSKSSSKNLGITWFTAKELPGNYPPGNDHISPKNGILSRWCSELPGWWDMLIPWRVTFPTSNFSFKQAHIFVESSRFFPFPRWHSSTNSWHEKLRLCWQVTVDSMMSDPKIQNSSISWGNHG